MSPKPEVEDVEKQGFSPLGSNQKPPALCQRSFALSLPMVILLIAMAMGGTSIGIAGWVAGYAQAAMASPSTGTTDQPSPSPPNQTQSSQTLPLTATLMADLYSETAVSTGVAFASEVTISGDGNRAAVSDKNGNNRTGAVYIYARDVSKNVWTIEAKVVPTDCKSNVLNGFPIGCAFGRSIALNHDGSVLAIGGSFDNTVIPGFGTGAAWTFTRGGSSWFQTGSKLVPAGVPNNGGVGTCAAISSDGNTVLIGALGMSSSFVFFRGDGAIVWSQQGGTLRGSGETGSTPSAQGTSCALSGDGNTAAIGGSQDSDGAGSIWIFVRNGATWSQQGSKLQVTDRNPQKQGNDIAITRDGNTVAVATLSGGVLVYQRSGVIWNFIFPMITSKENLSFFGTSVAMSGDGSTLLVSAPFLTGDGQFPGCVARFQVDSNGIFLFNRTACMSIPPPLLPAGMRTRALGLAMALSFNARHGVIGAPDSGFTLDPTGQAIGIAFAF